MDMSKAMMEIVDSYTASYWLKRAVVELSKRDPIDVMRDLETLTAIFEAKGMVSSAEGVTS